MQNGGYNMIIRISDSALTTTLGIGTTVADNYGFIDKYSTTVSSLTTTLSSSSPSDNYIYINSASNYLNSLSNEQIITLEQQIAAKEQETIKVGDKEFTLAQVEQLTATQQPVQPQQVKAEKPKTYKKI